MKKLFLFAITLCTCVTLFCERDTNWRRGWGRDVEPYLSDVTQWHPCSKLPPQRGEIVEKARCEGEPIPSSEPCLIDNEKQARRSLATQPQCIDRAIDVLTEASRIDAKATSDLAGALLVRAQRRNRPADLLDALEQADTAVNADATLAPARFNRALILETLELTQTAITAWDYFLEIGEGAPRAEAIRRRDQLRNRVWHQRKWRSIQRNLAAALQRGDRATVKQLIAPYASAAGRYFEETLLLQWADQPTPAHLAELRLFAEVLEQQFGDQFANDTVDAIEHASPAQLVSLRKGHRAFAEAQQLRRNFRREDAFPILQRASTLLGDSPFALRARLGLAQTGSVLNTPNAQTYRHLLARAQWTEAQLLSVPNNVGSLAFYDDALTTYRTLRDEEGLTAIHSRLSGVYRQLGDARTAWSEAYYSRRHRRRLMELNDRNAEALETALAARDLGHPRIALLYFNESIAELDAEDTRPDQDLPPSISTNLAVALRHRAALQLQISNRESARLDLARVLVLGTTNADRTIGQWLTARADEVLAHKDIRIGPADALPRLTSALANTADVHHGIRASLYVQRAAAYAELNRFEDQERDLLAAIDIREKEGAGNLAGNERISEDIWREYFNQFQDAYRMLIQLYMEQNAIADGFAFAERARAAEPLYRVGGKLATVDELRRLLPNDTYLLEYVVLDARSYVWVIGQNLFQAFPVAGKEEIRKLSADLQEAFRKDDRGRARTVLSEAHRLLLADAWNVISQQSRDPRLVIVPDDLLHGLPFAAFRNPKDEYLIQNATVEISGSAALYLYSRQRDRDMPFREHPSMLAIGNPEFDSKLPHAVGLKRLDHAEDEVDQIHDGYAGDEPWIGREGTVERFLAAAPAYDVIHIAAHGRVYADEAVLLLAKTPTNRGVLTAHDLAALKLERTRLVLFSACESAGGLPIGAEGLAPLVRPMLTAGVPGVVGTLWSVNDATTEELMVSFHAQYRKGSDAADSLREAQTEAIAQNKSVEAWAAFQVIGHASSPFARAPDLRRQLN